MLPVVARLVFVGGEAGELPPHWIWGNGKGEGRERGKGRVGRPTALLPPPTGFCLKYHSGCS